MYWSTFNHALQDRGNDPYIISGLAATGVSLPTLAQLNDWVALGVGLSALALGLGRVYYFFKGKWDAWRAKEAIKARMADGS